MPRPNQPLKVTENTVDDLAMRDGTIRKTATTSARKSYNEQAIRCRSLAPIH
jgi:hypothetical protein